MSTYSVSRGPRISISLISFRFYLIDSITQVTRMLHWISKYSKNYENVTVTDVTSHYSGLSLIGPASTKLLQSLTQTPLDVDDFPVNTIQVDSALKLNYKYYTGYCCSCSSLKTSKLWSSLISR